MKDTEQKNVNIDESKELIAEYDGQSAGDADRHSYSEFSHSDYSDSGCC